ncbi:YidB family protein [Acidiphilium sp. C61]|uniref:YidB family protein n=2 Tax=Acidiphilium TaxID=522 RepID=UPI00157B2E42
MARSGCTSSGGQKMGLFDGISGLVGSLAGGTAGGGLASALEGSGIDLSDITKNLQQGGLGVHLASWLGTGDNMPVSAADVQQALGNPLVEKIAAHFGIDTSAASQLIADHLPAAVSQTAAGSDTTDDSAAS